MITTAFIPAVSAAGSNATTLNMDTAGDSFPDKTPSGVDTHKATSNPVQSQENPPLWSEKNWSQPTSWTNTSSSTSAEIWDTGGSGTDASLAANATYVVTGSGETKLKVYDRETGTVLIMGITDGGRSAAAAGDADLEIRLVNATPDLGTFTEIFEITAHRTTVLDESEDFLATWSLHNGNENITRAEWFVWKERSHRIDIPIIEYRDIIPDDVTHEDAVPEVVAPEIVPFEGEAPINATPEPLPPEEDLPADAALETFVAQEPYIAGTETMERSWPEWVPFVPDGRVLSAGETRLFKVIYTKPAEIGQVDINTAPVFRGVACPELTWWSTAWATRVPVTVASPPSIDGYPHREAVSFRTGMQGDFDDVRFVTDDGTVLDYWKETYTASESAVIWVNLPAGATSIWMYYGNEAATDTGSRDNAYILYDDFDGPDPDTTLWTDTTPGAHYFADGWIYDARSQGAGALVSNEPVITNGEPVIVEMHIRADSLPSNAGYSCGAFPWFVNTPANGLLWYPESPSWDRYVFVNGAAAWRPGTARGLAPGGDYYSTWIITPESQTHTVSGSASYTDVFTGATGISSHQMQILGGNNAPEGRVVRMDWIRVRKYVETEPAFTYGAPQTVPVVKTVAVTPSIIEVVEGETIQFTATAYGQYGAAMEDIAFNWRSTNETVGTVTADGIFSARAAGTTTISAVTSTGGSHWGIATATVTHTVTPGSAWNWSADGWTGWARTASWTQPAGSCSEYGPVIVGDHGEHGADVHLLAGAVIGTVEHEFTDPSGVGWDGLTLVARVPGTDIPQGRWMTIEVNDEVVYAESGFSGSDPENFLPKEFHADFPQTGTVRVKVSHGQNPAWGTHFSMEYYSLELHPPSSAAPSITLTSPHDDTVGAGGTVTVAGNVSDPAITSLTLTHNGVSSTIPVEDGNFSAEVTLADANTITVGGSGSGGSLQPVTLLLDGDMLPAAFEQAIGFDPLNADSDCSQWPGDQSGNGIIDGYEVFAGDLPVFAKYRIGADPFVTDTDGDGLTDAFELLKLGTFPEEPGPLSMMGEGGPVVAAGTTDDPDGDGLSNLEEQTYGTDPLVADTDKDGLSDFDEIVMGTDPCAADTDGDGLADGAEAALGTNPLNPDSNGNGVPDGAEDYWSSEQFLDGTLDLTVFGRGYAVANVSVAAVNYTHLISDEILVSNVSAIGFGDDVESGTIAITYDPTHVENASRLSVYRFDEDLGTFVNVSSTIDSARRIVSCDATTSAKYAVLDSARWDALFENPTGTYSAMEPMSSPSGGMPLSEEVLRPPLLMPPEPLVEGVDYGAAFYDEPPAWYLEALEAEALEASFGGAGLDGSVPDAGTSSYYQVVANGDFWSGQQAWAPSGPYYDELSTYDRVEVDTYTSDYTSSPRSLKINVQARRQEFVESTVAHANVDLTHVDTLTFRYKCIGSADGGSLASSGLRFWVDGYGDAGMPNFRNPTTGQKAQVTPSWQTATVDVSGMTGQRTIYFRVFVSLNSIYSGISSATYLIDDVTAWSSEPPDDPNTANIRLFVKDSQTYAGVPYAQVICNGEMKYTDSRGYTYDFFVTSPGVLAYRVVAADYTIHDGYLRINPEDFGTSHTEYITVNRESAPVGSLYVTSTPNQAAIYVDNIFCGGTNGIVPDLLAGAYTVEVRKEGYATASRTVTVNANQQTNVHFDLTTHVGAIAVTSSPPGAAVYLDNTYRGTTSAASGQLTLSGLPVGTYRLDVLKEGYAPFTTTVTVVKDQTVSVTAILTNDDLDGDGLPDYYEENGYRDGFGRWHAPDPYLIDTDGDGLSDGYEAGELVTEGGKTFFKPRSDPTKADTDDDGLDDYLEDAIGSDPLNPDSDGDGLSDALEWEIGTDLWSADSDDDGHSDYEEWYDPDYDPLVYEERFGPLEMGREFLLGAVLGEWGVDDHDNLFYLGGWIASGVIVIGDIRDIAATLSRGDLIGTGLNLAALIPGYGDAAKVAAIVGKFVLKHPELLKPAMVLLVGVAPHVDEVAEAVGNARKIYGHATVDGLISKGLRDEDIAKWMRRGVDLASVQDVFRVGDSYIPMVTFYKVGKREGGYDHYIGRHVTGTLNVGKEGTTLFPMADSVTWFGKTYPGTSTLTQTELDTLIKGIIEQNPKGWTEWPDAADTITYEFASEVKGIKEIRIDFHPKFGFASAYPTKGSNVYMWYRQQWNKV